MSQEIHLSNHGLVALVDDEDFEWLSTHRWMALHSGAGKSDHWYAGRRFPRPENPSGSGTLLMHRDILGLKHGDPRQGDHINFNTLDNRRTNLRISDKESNSTRRNSMRGSTSRYVGVHWVKRYELWRAVIQHQGKFTAIGVFQEEQEAALARDACARKLNAGHTLNFEGGQ